MIHMYEIGVNPELIQRVRKFKESRPKVKGSTNNIGGWRSDNTDIIPKWFEKEYSLIKNLVGRNYRLYNCWFNVNGYGHYNRWHSHGTNDVVAVYYIKVPSKSGNIEFRENKTTVIKSFEPKPGEVVVFPGTLEHQVCKNESDDIRISAAFNFREVQNANR